MGKVLGKLRYVARVLSGIRLEKLDRALEKGKKRSGKGKLFLFFDMLWCFLRYGAGYNDYVMFAFYNMNRKQRDSYVTRLRNKKLITTLNDPDAADLFDRKTLFDPRFSAYLGRAFLVLPGSTLEEFLAFIQGKEVIFAKPDVGESGKGIRRLTVSDFQSPEAMYEYLMKGNFGVAEEALVQHKELSRLYPNSVNSLRIVTLLTPGASGDWDAHCVYAVIKTGTGGKYVDNLENGGLFCPINQDTGEITGVGHTSDLRTLENHPDTGIPLVGQKIPFVKESVALCKKAALEEPRMRLLGWDVCISPTGPVIIEGNDYPGYDFWQQPEHTPDKIGLWGYYREMVPELKRFSRKAAGSPKNT